MTRIDLGDRRVVVLLTPTPWKWTRYLRAWTRAGTEYCVVTECSGSGGLTGVLADPVGHNDLLLVVTDLAGMEVVVKYGFERPGLPVSPIAMVLPRSGWTEEYQRRWSAARAAWKDLSWPAYSELIEPDPGMLVAWADGWWHGREWEDVAEVGIVTSDPVGLA